jgi:hypothetical protein
MSSALARFGSLPEAVGVKAHYSSGLNEVSRDDAGHLTAGEVGKVGRGESVRQRLVGRSKKGDPGRVDQARELVGKGVVESGEVHFRSWNAEHGREGRRWAVEWGKRKVSDHREGKETKRGTCMRIESMRRMTRLS